MSDRLSLAEIDALLRADFSDIKEEAYMPVLKYCIVVEDKVYCYDVIRKKYIEAELTPKDNSVVPEEIEKLIVMKRFGLKEDR